MKADTVKSDKSVRPGKKSKPAAARSGKAADTLHGATKSPAMQMPGMQSGAMSMPIPMPAGMPMMPGLMGLQPDVTPFLPGAGVDPKTVPMVKSPTVARLRSGDTLDLTATLVRRTIRGHTFVTASTVKSPVP